MRNITQYSATATRVANSIFLHFQSLENPDYADWVLALMRKGFKKSEAVVEFQRRGMTVSAGGRIVFPVERSFEAKKQQERIREAQRDAAKQMRPLGVLKPLTPKQPSSIEKTLAEMQERAARMEAMAAEARRGLPPRMREAIPVAPAAKPRPVPPPPASNPVAPVEQRRVPISDVDKRIAELNSGFARLAEKAKQARRGL